MESNQLADFDFTCAYFNFTKFCSLCGRGRKTFKIPNNQDDEELSQEQKKFFTFVFVCRYCEWLNELDLEKIRNERVSKTLERMVTCATDNLLKNLKKQRSKMEFERRKKELQKEFSKLKSTKN